MPRQRYTPAEQEFYRMYINSPLWRARKEARIDGAGRTCEWQTDDGINPVVRCTRTRYLCVHHNTYERLGCENYYDLDVYCYFHHMLEHALWKKCVMCQAPCLENEIPGARWLGVVMASMGIDLDAGPVNWKNLPNKEVFLQQIPPYCPGCLRYAGKG